MNNQTIAETHSKNRKLVAYCVGKASFLAIVMNTIAVPSGMVAMLFMIHLSLVAILAASFIIIPLGVLLAITADGMTLGSCARLRTSIEQRIEIKNRYALIPEKEVEIELGETYELESLYPSYIVNGSLLVVFTVISGGAGWILWHTLLSLVPSFPWQLSVFLSTLFAISVSATLIASELLKTQNEKIIAESIEAAKFHKLAFKADAEEEAMKVLHKLHVEKAKDLENNPLLPVIVEESLQAIYNDILFEGENVIQQRIESDKVARERAERKRLDRVKEQQALLASKTDERDTGPIQQIASPKFKKLGNAEKVAQAIEKYGEPHIRRNIEAISAELGMHKTTIYKHLREA